MEKPFHFAYNPNQRQFIEDDRRYKEKLSQITGGKIYNDEKCAPIALNKNR